MAQLSHPYTATGKTIALNRQTFVSKVMSLLFNMLSMFVMPFLPSCAGNACIKKQIVKAMIFPVVMYRCESWTIKRLHTKELMLLNCGAGEDSLESL